MIIMTKKNSSIFLKILGLLFIIYIGLFIANVSGYYESKIRDKVVVTKEGIKEFEEKVQNGDAIDVTSFLNNERIDYRSNMSNLGDNLTNGLEDVVDEGAKIIKNIIRSLF